MNVSVENGDRGKLFDADGVQIKGLIISANLDTGEVTEYATDEKGKVVVGDEGPEKLTRFHKAPLVFERCASVAARTSAVNKS